MAGGQSVKALFLFSKTHFDKKDNKTVYRIQNLYIIEKRPFSL